MFWSILSFKNYTRSKNQVQVFEKCIILTFQIFRYLKSENGSEDLKFHANPRVIPFGLGKRRCLGETLAKMSLYKFFSALIQKYEIVSGQTEPITDERDLGFIKAPLKYKLIFKPRAECK